MRSLKKISHRDWSATRDLWIEFLPDIDFEVDYPEPTIFDFKIVHPPVNASGYVEISYIDGVREAVFREVILLSRKFCYCATMLPLLSSAGKSAWTTITAYEASFYCAKALCYLLGFVSLGPHTSHYADIFHETFRKENKRKVPVYDTILVHKFEERLTHRVLWSLTARLISTTKFPEELRDIQTEIRLVDWDEFRGFRNRMLYDGGFWPYSENLPFCDLTKPTNVPSLQEAAYLDNELAEAPYAPHYFKTALLLRKLIVGMLETIGELAPIISPHVEALRPSPRVAPANTGAPPNVGNT